MGRLRDARDSRDLRVLFRKQHHSMPYALSYLPQALTL